jgi:glucose-6-phosphate 1-dehydrogenase
MAHPIETPTAVPGGISRVRSGRQRPSGLQRPEPQDIVVVGATGNLAQRKLLPALYNLHVADLLPPAGRIIGLALSPLDPDGFRDFTHKSVKRSSRTGLDEKSWAEFAQRLSFVDAHSDASYDQLKEHSTQHRRLVYLAVPPSALPDIVRNLETAGLASGTRLVVEKPFGRDLSSARELNRIVHRSFAESQVFRIDHWLGKETVQNILAFRFGNSVFERMWSRDAIDHVQITMAESIGVEGRGAFYEEVGAVRDVVQNHVLQMLSLLTMEPPANMAAESIRDEKGKVFHAMRPLDPDQTVRAQYMAGAIDGQVVPGYRQEPGVAPDSDAETFFAAQVEIDTWRWAGVPFFIRAGKRLPRRTTEVAVGFRDVPLHFFTGTGIEKLPPNRLILRIQPDEGISFSFAAKRPGPEMTVKEVRMDFSYQGSFMTEPEEAYERLLHDAMIGDHTLFTRADSIEGAWTALQPVLERPAPLRFYQAGTWGPPEARRLIAPHAWEPA